MATAAAEALAAAGPFSAVRSWRYPVRTNRDQRSESRNRLPEGLGRGWRDPGSDLPGPHHPGGLKEATIQQFGEQRQPNGRGWRAPAPSLASTCASSVDPSIGLPEPMPLGRVNAGSGATLSPIRAELDIYVLHMRPA